MTENQIGRPTELRISKDRKNLKVIFDTGKEFELPAEALRVLSPSAEVQGHSPEQRVTVPGKRHVQIAGVEPIGNYAIKINFDDGHNTGIFSWTYLHTLGDEFDARWTSYLNELEAKGMSRDLAEIPR